MVTQGRTLKAGTESETMEDHCLLSHSQPQVQLLFLYRLSKGGTAHSGLSLSVSIINQESAPTDTSTGYSDGDSSSVEGPSSQVCQVDNHGEPSECPTVYTVLALCRHIKNPEEST